VEPAFEVGRGEARHVPLRVDAAEVLDECAEQRGVGGRVGQSGGEGGDAGGGREPAQRVVRGRAQPALVVVSVDGVGVHDLARVHPALMPSPGMPNTVSTSQSASREIRT
jgi:hypothetical protein